MRAFKIPALERCIALLGVVIVMFGFSGAANAVLGGKVDSVAADQVQMKASLKVSSTGRFEVHELRTSGGNVVREFVSPEGNVFAVAWTGHAVPQYSQLLGSFAQKITAAAQARHNHRAPLVINEPGFVFSAFGHMRFYSGRAYIPSLVPAGVQVEEIR